MTDARTDDEPVSRRGGNAEVRMTIDTQGPPISASVKRAQGTILDDIKLCIEGQRSDVPSDHAAFIRISHGSFFVRNADLQLLASVAPPTRGNLVGDRCSGARGPL
jgi:hypothetical protein